MSGKKTGKTCLSAIEFFNGYVTKVEFTLDRKFCSQLKEWNFSLKFVLNYHFCKFFFYYRVHI